MKMLKIISSILFIAIIFTFSVSAESGYTLAEGNIDVIFQSSNLTKETMNHIAYSLIHDK